MNSPRYYNSFKAGEIVDYKYQPSICDGIAWGQSEVQEEPAKLIMETLDDMVVVSEDRVKDAVKYLALENNLVTEGARAIAVAAALDMDQYMRGRCACILSGDNST